VGTHHCHYFSARRIGPDEKNEKTYYTEKGGKSIEIEKQQVEDFFKKGIFITPQKKKGGCRYGKTIYSVQLER